MSSLLLLTNALQPSTEVLPALGLLLHNVRVAPAEGPALVDTPGADVILVDGRRDLPQVRSLCQLLRSTGPGCPLVLVVTEGGLAAVTADWGIDDVLLEVWGYDYFGGTRTVDVHVRRLRAKLGPEHESLIGTVRNVGYRFVTPEKGDRGVDEAKAK